jgi:hypothetical protein
MVAARLTRRRPRQAQNERNGGAMMTFPSPFALSLSKGTSGRERWHLLSAQRFKPLSKSLLSSMS